MVGGEWRSGKRLSSQEYVANQSQWSKETGGLSMTVLLRHVTRGKLTGARAAMRRVSEFVRNDYSPANPVVNGRAEGSGRRRPL